MKILVKTVVDVSIGATFKASHYKFCRKALIKRSTSNHKEPFGAISFINNNYY